MTTRNTAATSVFDKIFRSITFQSLYMNSLKDARVTEFIERI